MGLIPVLCLLWGAVSVFMILVILVQRGRGGGLAGALGGMGGSSAFGSKAGDVFTKITVVVFLVWLSIGLILVPMMKSQEEVFEGGSKANQESKDSEATQTGEQETESTEKDS